MNAVNNIYGLKRITQMGGKVAIMTATLSPFVKELLMREVAFKEENIGIFTNDMVRHHVKTIDSMINAEDITQLYYENQKKKKSNKILVVCNTIKKAQELYKQLFHIMDSSEQLHILHSRFTKEDRAIKEQEIIEFGKLIAKQ